MRRERRTMLGGTRRRLARWLDPTAPTVDDPAALRPVAPPPTRHPVPVGGRGPADDAARQWSGVLEQLSLRILSAVYQTAGQLESMEHDEQDPARLDRLYRVDHAVTRIRRHAENMQVLAGRPVEDADRQVTGLLDVIRAAASAIDQYDRVQLGRIADLAVVEFAADDAMRVVTELLDNATRYSPPNTPVTVSAHLTEQGSVLVRIEDTGLGVRPADLAALNALLSGELPGRPDTGRLGLPVVARLAAAHHLRVSLTARQSGGTTATVLLPSALLCEIPSAAAPPHAAPSASDRPHLVRVADAPAAPPGDVWPHEREAPRAAPVLPRRVKASLRGTPPADETVEVPALPVPADRRPWHEDVAAFAAGAEDEQRHEGQA
ncbi:sensor histidine kinase [Actinocatenispora rupis]|uniref:histidine kinase n=1 Tax=Actinocatenispora rupis TaxID=519421 RepID=A0A8J3J6F8_9ACTN|nr:ATP-binding protein [Actinocatenispora rupis]GID12910.1 histidine kinase [Actinocatenispora rupis]